MKALNLRALSFVQVESVTAYPFGPGDTIITYNKVEVLQDVPELGLKKGAKYDVCYLEYEDSMMHFIVWEKIDPDRPDSVLIPNKKKSFRIKLPDA